MHTYSRAVRGSTVEVRRAREGSAGKCNVNLGSRGPGRRDQVVGKGPGSRGLAWCSGDRRSRALEHSAVREGAVEERLVGRVVERRAAENGVPGVRDI